MNLSLEAIQALAPDAGSAKAARNLSVLRAWPRLGGNDHALWGACQGSGAKPYQTQVDLSAAAPAFKCSCPSRKFPCKHGLALLLLRQQHAAAFTDSAAPDWVLEWLGARQEKALKKDPQPRMSTAAVIDPDAAQKRENQRWMRIDQAREELQRWLLDQLERGLAVLDAQSRAQWHGMAARMVDAQAPGLGRRIRKAADLLQAGPGWPQQVLRELGALQLLCDALARRAELPSVLQSDVRVQLGWPLDKSEVLEQGERVVDRWTVLGQALEEREGQLLERRVWFNGAASGRDALLLEHAHGDRGFASVWHTGQSLEAELAFYPSAVPQRALVVELGCTGLPPLWPQRGVDQQAARWAQHIAVQPWVGLAPWMLQAARIWPSEQTVIIVQQDGCILPSALTDSVATELLALSGGQELKLFGEWDGARFTPLSACSAEGLWQRHN